MNTMLNALKRPKKLSCKEMLSNQGMKTKRLAKIKKKKKRENHENLEVCSTQFTSHVPSLKSTTPTDWNWISKVMYYGCDLCQKKRRKFH